MCTSEFAKFAKNRSVKLAQYNHMFPLTRAPPNLKQCSVTAVVYNQIILPYLEQAQPQLQFSSRASQGPGGTDVPS